MLSTLRHIHRHPLSARQPLQGFLRFARWQMACKLLPGASISVPFTDAARLLLSKGMHGATQNYYCGLNDFEEMSFLIHYLHEGDVFVDVGANVGAYTVLASAVSRATTYAFEPAPKTAADLQSNISLNHVEHLVHTSSCALGSRDGTVQFLAGGNGAMFHVFRAGDHGDKLEIPVRTLDSFDLRPAIIKVDVEGYESEVLAGCHATLAKPEMVCVIVEDSDDGDQYGKGLASVSDVMRQFGFTAMNYDPWTRTLGNKDRKHDNTLFIRDSAVVRQRLQEAKPFGVQGLSI
jgi:FkbM family methyltransferase